MSRTAAARAEMADTEFEFDEAAYAEQQGMLAALNKSQAVIHFGLDGIILDANDNFLAALGYSLAEIKGQHHSMFVSPEQRNSHEYRMFWDKLGRGEYDAGEYKRVARGGREIWIQASYNPILDASGRPSKVVKYATDITAQKVSNANFQGQIDAIGKSQAVIEFGLDGVIVDANDNFLATLGYSLAEIKGQHHSMFMPSDQRHSHEYRMFWEKLGRGEYDAGEYKRVGKGGKEVWIQASYNPIMDINGRPMKVVKYATDITAQKVANADFQGQINAISKSQAVIEFDLEGRIADANANFLATVGYSIEEIRGQHHSMFVPHEHRSSPEYRAFWDKLRRGEYDAGKYQRVGKGGKEIWLQASYNPILDMNGKPFKVVKYATDITEVTEQRRAAGRIKEVAEMVSAAATEMRATAEAMAHTAQEASHQASSVTNAAQLASSNVQTVSAAGEELSASIAEIARQVAESTNITQQAVAETNRTSDAIQSLAEAAKKIGNVVTLINNIAGQTKLLALNATIEAARAGDAGKGFAVVASEVKSLSDQTAKATHEISSEVSAMQAATATSVTAIQGIAGTIGKVAEIASAIASAVEEQSAATGEISANVVQAAESTREVTSNIEQLSEGVAQTGQAASEILKASDDLAIQAETLTSQMDALLS